MTIIKNQIKDFKNYLTQLGYSKTTLSMLPECVSDFLHHAKQSPQNITPNDVQLFYEYLQIRPNKNKSGGLSEQYINHHIYALRVFFNWLELTGEIRYNPMSVLKFKRPEGNPREPLTQAEIQSLFDAAESLKERAILHLFYSCGLRRNEAERLNSKDVHLKTQMLYVREGKGAKRRVVPMTLKVSTDLESYYLRERTNQVAVSDQEAFILNRAGSRMRGDGYNNVLKEIIARTEIIKQVSLHHLRHSIATHLLESGLSIEYVRDFLGHAFLETTQGYAKVNQHQLNKL
jgi:integrase/recombinase XerD